MDKYEVYVDGQAGTTGLQILDRLSAHPNVNVTLIPEEERRDEDERKRYLNKADVVFLCLPDQAAEEAVTLLDADNTKTRIIDASTAHRVHEHWVYGLPELSSDRWDAITLSTRVANPGCHATAFLLCVMPLVKAGIIPADYPLSCHSITGYSGGGKAMIAEYEDADRSRLYPDYDAPREYGLGQIHKHLPEMHTYSGLAYPPGFSPIVADFPRGLAVFVPLAARLLRSPDSHAITPRAIVEYLTQYYAGSPIVSVMPYEGGDTCDGKAHVNAMACNGTDKAEIIVLGNGERITLVCRLDNLGKGAGGAAIQNMNIMLGLPQETGLVLS